MYPIYYLLITVLVLIMFMFSLMNYNAFKAKKSRKTSSSPRKTVAPDTLDQYALKLQKMIQCKTVYCDDYDDTEFAKFRKLLENEFPNLHKQAELKIYGTGCLIYKISGKNTNKNVMLMSHHDVVEAEGEWTHLPFSGEIADGALWGRGTVDTKTPFFAELQAVEELLAEGYNFGYNVYIGSSNNEEVCGDGIPFAVEDFKKNNIKFSLVLDEGGAITKKLMPGVTEKSAMIAVHEKGRHTFKCTAKSGAGHQGLNPTNSNTISRMSAFINEVNKSKIFDKQLYPEVEATFIKHAPYMSYPYRLLFSNLKLLKNPLTRILPKVNKQVSAMMQTSLYFTTIHGGSREQVQAREVVAYAFFRCVRNSILAEEIIMFKEIAKKYNIIVEESVVDYCKPTSFTSEYYNKLENVLNTNFPDVIVAPFLLTAGSDARRFTDIADNILRFAPIDLNEQQYASIHNNNENITVSNIGECVCFYKDYIKAIEDIK